ncbi:hypothetical protein [Roseimaritima multifibrata]|nr:hypothetical protein [Roseimaritima multifibrata]
MASTSGAIGCEPIRWTAAQSAISHRIDQTGFANYTGITGKRTTLPPK